MRTYERAYCLESRLFTVSKNADGFPVHTIVFSSHQSEEAVNGALRGDGISSGAFLGRFVAPDQIELFFQWFDRTSSFVISGRLWGFICGNPSEGLQLFLNWHFARGSTRYGAVSYTELKQPDGVDVPCNHERV
ncbi:hypothetical protein [Desulfobulbus elongatus]|uniref:hypothetical protein n=1 Tax=Desulfobulbus elongatus TaxID=53332 RepID=UPI000483426A|nr:hypothetical protein [Desulfobulbus elongatus]